MVMGVCMYHIYSVIGNHVGCRAPGRKPHLCVRQHRCPTIFAISQTCSNFDFDGPADVRQGEVAPPSASDFCDCVLRQEPVEPLGLERYGAAAHALSIALGVESGVHKMLHLARDGKATQSRAGLFRHHAQLSVPPV